MIQNICQSVSEKKESQQEEANPYDLIFLDLGLQTPFEMNMRVIILCTVVNHIEQNEIAITTVES